MRKLKESHTGILNGIRKNAFNIIVASGVTAAAILPFKVNAQTMEGRLTDASITIPTGVPALIVSLEGVGDGISSEDGRYRISSNAVNPRYDITNTNGNTVEIYDVLGRLVDKVEFNGAPFFWNENVAKGVYFASDGVNPACKFVNRGEGTWVNIKPVNLAERVRGKSGRSTMNMDEIYLFSVNGFVNLDNPQAYGWNGHQRYHNFSRCVDITDILEYNIQMIPVIGADENADGSETILDVLKLLTYTDGSGGNTRLERWHDEDLPIPEFLGDYSGMREGLEVLAAFEHADNDIFEKSGRRLYDMNFQDDSVQVGINYHFTIPPHGIGWTDVVASYEDGAPKLVDIYIHPGINSQEALNLTVERERMRALIMFDRSDDEGYVMHIGGTSAGELHPNEGKALGIMYNLEPVEYNETTSWPDMEWYQTSAGDVVVGYRFNESKK